MIPLVVAVDPLGAHGSAPLAERPDNLAIVTRAQDRVRQTGEGLTSEQILELLDAGRADRE